MDQATQNLDRLTVSAAFHPNPAVGESIGAQLPTALHGLGLHPPRRSPSPVSNPQQHPPNDSLLGGGPYGTLALNTNPKDDHTVTATSKEAEGMISRQESGTSVHSGRVYHESHSKDPILPATEPSTSIGKPEVSRSTSEAEPIPEDDDDEAMEDKTSTKRGPGRPTKESTERINKFLDEVHEKAKILASEEKMSKSDLIAILSGSSSSREPSLWNLYQHYYKLRRDRAVGDGTDDTLMSDGELKAEYKAFKKKHPAPLAVLRKEVAELEEVEMQGMTVRQRNLRIGSLAKQFGNLVS